MAQSCPIPGQHTALVFHSTSEPLQIEEKPVPEATSGSAVIQVIASTVLSYTKDVYDGTRDYPYPTPYTPGLACVGRVAATGRDATTLSVGDLVLYEIFLRGRDNPEELCLQGLHADTDGTSKLVSDEFRDGTYAEYVRVPLENCTKVPDDGRDPADWMNLHRMLIPYGGMTNNGGLDVRPGETVVVAPATGQFGGSGVEIALTMGAKVVALGRNAEALKNLQKGLSVFGSRLKTVQITGDIEKDAESIGPVDCYFDISPPEAVHSTHFQSCLKVLKPRGRVCIMGHFTEDVPLPFWKILKEGITIMGKWMYEANAARELVHMVEIGLLDLGRHTSKSFGLEDWKTAFEHASQNMRWGQQTIITPGASGSIR